ncbi:MAG: ABC transporter permease subunit [Chloroflexi bacterium]|nr:ABC transporter permease subunit [Chloroflexota bacterium]
MITDVLVVMSKEIKEFLLQRGESRRSGWVNILVVLGLLGVYMPVMSKAEWLTNPVVSLSWSWLPIFLTSAMITDSFAGERERHTLGTLLASRLSDQAILFGKILAAVVYACGLTLASLLLGAVTVNVITWGEGLRFYALLSFAGAMLLMVLVALLMSSVGVLVSLRSATVRSAYQKLSLAIMAVWVVPMLVLQFLPKETIAGWMDSLAGMQINLGLVLLGVGAVLAVIDAVLLAVARARFQRSRLILD